MVITIIGSGNVAWVLGRACKAAGHEVRQVIARHPEKGKRLAQALEARYAGWPGTIDKDTHICLLAVADGAIAPVADALQAGNAMLVHTAGAVAIHTLRHARRHGVLYPLQSLKKELAAEPVTIPLLVDGNTPWVSAALLAFAKTLSPNVAIANDTQRLQYHLAAVVVSNFTNHLYALAADYCQQNRLDFSQLYPLITEVANRIHHHHPALLQTGPAVRGDLQTQARHLDLLHENKNLYDLYQQITASITAYYASGAQKNPAEHVSAGPMASKS